MRIDKAKKYFKLAEAQAELFSKDPTTKVCALFLAPESLNVLTSGVNGFPRKVIETEARWERPHKYDRVNHAEVNGICNAARHGISLQNSIAVITMFPCCDCAKSLIQVGVDMIITRQPNYNDPVWGHKFRLSTEMFEEVGMKMIILDRP